MKTHLNLATRDLAKSVAFYRTLLDAEPAKSFDDYALFITEDPGLELALDRDTRAEGGSFAHFGVVVDSAEAVDAAIERLQAAGLPVDVEREETCCYAKQTKVWAIDPEGRRWEVYTVLEDTESRNEGNVTCCSDADPDTEACCAV
ncbi:MAG TPA: ArsI/CadI family heavy metal resistance metalloenzyme [Candidatus Eremiobacteraceae bacterium]